MKILILTNNTDPGNGWGRYASELIGGLRSRGHEVTTLTAPLLKRGLGMFSSAKQIQSFAKKVDLVHALDVYPYGIIAALACRAVKKPFVVSLQGSYAIAPFYSFKTHWLSKWACRRAKKLIAISQYTKKEFNKILANVEPVIINHGIDFGRYYVSRDDGSRAVILSVGALKYRKGYHIAIPAFALAKKKMPNLKYIIVGDQNDPTYLKLLKDLAAKHGVSQDIEFIQKVSEGELRKLYARATLFLLSSVNHGHHFEGFGLVFLEAAAAGLPVIGTGDNGIGDALKEGYNGFLVPQNSVEETAQAIIKVLDPSRYDQLSQNSYLWAKSHPLEEMINRYISIYESN